MPSTLLTAKEGAYIHQRSKVGSHGILWPTDLWAILNSLSDVFRKIWIQYQY